MPQAQPAQPSEISVNVNPAIQTQVSPVISPTFTQVQDSPGAQTGSATSAQQAPQQGAAPRGSGADMSELTEFLRAQAEMDRRRREEDARIRREEEARRAQEAAARAEEERRRQEQERIRRQQAEAEAAEARAASQRQAQEQQNALAQMMAALTAQRQASTQEAQQAALAEQRDAQARIDAQNAAVREQYDRALAEWREMAAAAASRGTAPPTPQPVAPQVITVPQTGQEVLVPADSGLDPTMLAIIAGVGLLGLFLVMNQGDQRRARK